MRSPIPATPTPAPATTCAKSTGGAAWTTSTASRSSACRVRAASAPPLHLHPHHVILRESVCVCVCPGCKLGEASEFLVQQDARIEVPTRTGLTGCHEVCSCGPSGRLENCAEMPCVDTDEPCIVGGERKSEWPRVHLHPASERQRELKLHLQVNGAGRRMESALTSHANWAELSVERCPSLNRTGLTRDAWLEHYTHTLELVLWCQGRFLHSF